MNDAVYCGGTLSTLLDFKASRSRRKIAYSFHHGNQFGIILCLFAYVRTYERSDSLKHEF